MSNRIIIHFFGLKRSGNHPVINWIINNVGNVHEIGTIHHNDVFDINRAIPKILRSKDLRINNEGNFIAVLSYEDVSLGLVKDLPTIKKSKEILPRSLLYNIIILRDPFNFFASRMSIIDTLNKKGLGLSIQKIEIDEVVGMWIDYAKEFLNITNRLSNKIAISYNNWFCDKKYRDDIINKYFLSINYDYGLNDVPDNGRGSSFDELMYDGCAQEMAVMERWKKFIKNPNYVRIFRNKELITLSRKVFGHINGTEEIYNH